MTNTQNAVTSTPVEVGFSPAVLADAALDAPTTCAGWLVKADKFGQSMFDAVRNGALLAAESTVVEFDAGEVITADKRARAIRAKHEDVLSKLSETNRGNIRNWFANVLVLHFTAAATPDAVLEIAAPSGNNGAVTVKAADAVKLSKNALQKAAKSARSLEGTNGNNAGKTLNSGAAVQTEADATVDTSNKLPAESAALVTMWAQIDTMLASIGGLNLLRDGLKTRGYTLSAFIPEDDAAAQAEQAAAEADKAEQRKSRSKK